MGKAQRPFCQACFYCLGYDAFGLRGQFFNRIFEKESKLKILVSGSLGLVGSEAVRFYLNSGHIVVGIDNDMRKTFFGNEGSGSKNAIEHANYIFADVDLSECPKII